MQPHSYCNDHTKKAVQSLYKFLWHECISLISLKKLSEINKNQTNQSSKFWLFHRTSSVFFRTRSCPKTYFLWLVPSPVSPVCSSLPCSTWTISNKTGLLPKCSVYICYNILVNRLFYWSGSEWHSDKMTRCVYLAQRQNDMVRHFGTVFYWLLLFYF